MFPQRPVVAAKRRKLVWQKQAPMTYSIATQSRSNTVSTGLQKEDILYAIILACGDSGRRSHTNDCGHGPLMG